MCLKDKKKNIDQIKWEKKRRKEKKWKIKMNKDWDCLGIDILQKNKNKKWIKGWNYFKIDIIILHKNVLHILTI